MNAAEPRCRLCHSSAAQKNVTGGDKRRYWHCPDCDLIYVESSFLPSLHDEKTRYLNHENGIEHDGHVRFLNQAIGPAMFFLRPGMRGLDYGCGPVPALSKLLALKNISCDDYDPFFFDKIPGADYDFIFCTEVLEHMFEPGRDIKNLKSLLNPGGLWVGMTEMWSDLEKIKNWPYARDFTHVCFYQAKTFDFICAEFGFEYVYNDGQRVFILKKVETKCTDRE